MADTAREKEWLSLKDVQPTLGIGGTKACELVATGELPAVRIGHCIRVDRGKLEGWPQTQRYLSVVDREVAWAGGRKSS